MRVIAEAWTWLTTGANWSGDGGAAHRLAEHLYVSGIALTVDGGWLAEKSFVSGAASGSSFLAGRETTGAAGPAHEDDDAEPHDRRDGGRREQDERGQVHSSRPYPRWPRIIRRTRSHRSLSEASAPSDVGL